MNSSDIYKKLRLLPYQADFAANDARFKIGLWARQTGKDHTATAEAVIDCIFNPGTSWIIVGACERQGLETLSKAKSWAEILKFRIADYRETPPNLRRASASTGLWPAEDGVSPSSVLSSSLAEIKWANGSRLIALPANPPTIRGFTGNVLLTEFAFQEDAAAVWQAVYPYLSNTLRGIKKLRIISTPNGLNNKFADLWFNTPTLVAAPRESAALVSVVASKPDTGNSKLAPYYKSKVTIHDAIKSGLPLDAHELRAGLNDEDAWSQEYLCEFMDSSTVMFPYDLIAPCESEQATESLLTPNLNPTPNPLFAGLDFGRKHNLSVCWILERLPGTVGTLPAASPHLFLTREVLSLKNTSTPEQLDILRPRLKRCRKICVDYTGAGVGLGDYIAREFGGGPLAPIGERAGVRGITSNGKVELCQFTPALKAELFPRLRAAFESRVLRIPISREIREDLHAIQRTVTHSGQITYRAPQTPDGHSDRTTALALALRAASSAPASAIPTLVYGPPPRSGPLGCSLRMPRWHKRKIWF